MIEPVSDYLILDVNISAHGRKVGISVTVHRRQISKWIPTTQDETLESSIDKAAEKADKNTMTRDGR